MMNQATIALAGNPNAGKSTIFNALTGEHQHVGNWPGKTVERKEGEFSINGVTMNIIDLPGTYSLTAYSMEEKITRDFLLQNQPDAVVAVVDAANLERNLYLVVQMLELGVPIVIALNMADMAESRGLKIDTDQLAAGLNVPIIRTIATRNEGLEELKQTVAQAVQNRAHRPARSRTGDVSKHDAPRCPNCG
ncbi:MAG TPA: FeoB small GTPase domain-containing protein [Aggregatilinea sp.]|uniref:FeoB small GTPase domain-containing protein n=1 Tax=Aggregatilinea sp. TaxID=2806333 RepID=UPI002C129C57|nr:FeoB small GTPase domain-containing protein [Aggregatilinea sp.]HML22408.1 FeoB small GTPase domain-containing protein [Aggregatilinea sp.]